MSGQVPIDMAELVEHITKQFESTQFLTTSFNRLISLILDLVTTMKQSLTWSNKASSKSKQVHHAPAKENIIPPPIVTPKINYENPTIDDFFQRYCGSAT